MKSGTSWTEERLRSTRRRRRRLPRKSKLRGASAAGSRPKMLQITRALLRNHKAVSGNAIAFEVIYINVSILAAISPPNRRWLTGRMKHRRPTKGATCRLKIRDIIVCRLIECGDFLKSTSPTPERRKNHRFSSSSTDTEATIINSSSLSSKEQLPTSPKVIIVLYAPARGATHASIVRTTRANADRDHAC